MHFILSGAYKGAVRWKWVMVNPLRQAEPPAAPMPNPHPPSAAEAARIVNEAWKDPDWGALMAERLAIETTLHKLRHYSATELISAGVDVRTVAGRLGHSGGGTTTLRTYTAWMSEADQRAASGIATRMPSRPAPLKAVERAKCDPQSPYAKIAAELRLRILSGVFADGDLAPYPAPP